MSTPLRPSLVCDTDRIVCPRCGEVVRRITVGEGSSVALCERTLPPRAENRFRDKCGQHIYVAGSDGFANVFPITREEYEYLTATALQKPSLALVTLGVLRTRDVERVPSRECTQCRERRKTFDLYEGVCRWCRGDQQVSA